MSQLPQEDILYLLLISKIILIWGKKLSVDIIEPIFKDSSLNQTKLKRYVLNLKNKITEVNKKTPKRLFYAKKNYDAFKESEIAKEILLNHLFDQFPMGSECKLPKVISKVTQLEKDLQIYYQNRIDPILKERTKNPWWKIHESVMKNKKTLLTCLENKYDIERIKATV